MKYFGYAALAALGLLGAIAYANKDKLVELADNALGALPGPKVATAAD